MATEDFSPNNFPDDYKTSDVDSRVLLRSNSVSTKAYGDDVREAIYDGLNIASAQGTEANKIASQANATSKDTQDRFNAQINGQDKDDEAKDARVSPADGKTYNVLKDRLDAMDKKPQAAVDNLEVGGTNLLYGTDFYINRDGDTRHDLDHAIIGDMRGKTVTMSFLCDVQEVSALSGQQRILYEIKFTNSDGTSTYQRISYSPKIGDTHWGRMSQTFYFSNDVTNVTFGVWIQGISAKYIRVGRPKLELGSKATSWSPAPEDNYRHQAFRHGTRFFAHRGAQSIAPENSLPAIRKASNHAGVEIDIHVTSDGSWVVMHDDTVDRMTNGTGNVSSFTFANIRKLRIDTGSLVDRYSDNDLIIPTLEEVLLICKNQQLIPVVEIKVDSEDSYTSDNWDSLANIITKFGLQDEMMFISFNYAALQEVKKRLPLVEVSYLVGSISTDLITQAQALGVNSGLDVAYDNSTVTAGNVTACHNAGLKVGVWTTTDDSKRNSLVGLGVDFITTNSLSGEKRYAELSLQNNWKRYNTAVDVPHVQETSDGQIAIEFVINGGKNNNGDVIATVPDWATPAFVQWCNGVGRTADGATPISFNISNDGTVTCGVNWTVGNGAWYTCRATYHV